MSGLGYEVPELLRREILKSNYSGDLDYRKCVVILDGTIFKDSAMYDKPDEDIIDNIKRKLLTKLARKDGASSVLGKC